MPESMVDRTAAADGSVRRDVRAGLPARRDEGAIAAPASCFAETPNAWMPQQFENEANIEVHAAGRRRRRSSATSRGPRLLITGVGTGGHITGCAEVSRSACRPAQGVRGRAGGVAGDQRRRAFPPPDPGIGAGFVPKNLHVDLLDGVIQVGKDEAFTYAARCAKEEGILVGISSGASLAAVAKKLPDLPAGARVLTFLLRHRRALPLGRGLLP